MTTRTTRRLPNKVCLNCSRKSIYPEKDFSDWFYPREQTCFDCIMIRCNRYDKIRCRKLSGKMSDKAELLFPLTVVDTSNNTKVGESAAKDDPCRDAHNKSSLLQ